MKLIVWHLEIVERLDGQDIEPYPAVDEGLSNLHVADDWEQSIESCFAINEGPGDLHVVDDRGAKHREDSVRCRALELIR